MITEDEAKELDRPKLLKYFRTLKRHVEGWYDEWGLDDKQKADIKENDDHIDMILGLLNTSKE